MNIVYLNGAFIDKKKAAISVMDRGFLFGDSVYEVIPAFKKKLIGGIEHFERLQRSLDAVLMQNPFSSYKMLTSIIYELISKNKLELQNCSIYIQISRGAEETRSHRIPDAITPTIFILCTPFTLKTKTELLQGFKAVTHNDIRRDTNFIKSTALASNVMLLEKAREKGALETILLRNGNVLECTASNLFIVKDDVLMTPPLSNLILAGITRSLILKLAHDAGISTKETSVSESMLRSADEIWVTGSIKEISPIITLDDQPVGNGSVGPIWKQLYTLYQDYKETQS